MIKLDLYRILLERGIENPNQFLKKCGVPTYTASRLLHNNLQSLSFRYMETICLQLNCTLDDLCTWIPGENKALYKHHPLNKLKRTAKDSISSKLKGLTLDELDKVRGFINEIEKSKEG